MLDIAKILTELSLKRPIFHSEADFQHALAWELHQKWPKCSMRLEFKPPYLTNRMYVDIWATSSEVTIAIELKYKTKAFRTNIHEENLDLSNHSAPDEGRYDFLKDVQRLEQVVYKHSNTIGYAIFLSNDNTYWNPPANTSIANDLQFRIHQGNLLNGELSWRAGALKKAREKPIIISSSYILAWQDYSNLDGSPKTNGKFRVLLVKTEAANITMNRQIDI